MKEWIREFAQEGPYREDVGALVKHLGKVVRDERDLSKAVGVVKWLVWVVDDLQDEGVKAVKWEEALGRVKDGVIGAARERGMGAVSFK